MFENNNLLTYFSKEKLEEILRIEDLYKKAYILVSVLFKDIYDNAGKPYFYHLLRVANRLDDESEKVAGLLHDTIEDTLVSYEDLLEIGFPKDVLDIVLLVTKEDIDTANFSEKEKLSLYKREIDKIISSGNIHAIKVKEADMSDNFDPNRLVNLPQKRQEWLNKKYSDNIIRLRRTIRGDE